MIPMTHDEKIQCAKDTRSIFNDRLASSEHRTAQLSDEFTRLEVQIATILFAFGGLFVGPFIEGLKNYSPTGVMAMKIIFVLIFVFLILSLILGLVHLKRAEFFWDMFVAQRYNRFAKWEEVVKGTATFEQAESYQKGTALGNGSNVISAPHWTWILQTICLGFAVLLLVILFTVFLFN